MEIDDDIQWKDIPGYEGVYKISEYGDVLSLSRYRTTENKIIKPYKNNKNYLCVPLCYQNIRKIFLVHRLVAMSFLSNDNNYPVVNHIDGNKLNNHYTNLEWCTLSYNQIHAIKIGLRKNFKNGGKSRRRPVYKIDPITKDILQEYESISEAARQYGVGQSCIKNCCDHKIRKVKNYIWRYKNEYNKEEEIKDTYIYDKAVLQIKDGIVINTFDSIKEASDYTGIGYSNIAQCCHHRKNQTCGYIWRFRGDKNI